MKVTSPAATSTARAMRRIFFMAIRFLELSPFQCTRGGGEWFRENRVWGAARVPSSGALPGPVTERTLQRLQIAAGVVNWGRRVRCTCFFDGLKARGLARKWKVGRLFSVPGLLP